MNKLLAVTLTSLFGILFSSVAIAQQVPYDYIPPKPIKVERCYTVLLPLPHIYCEYVYILNYSPAPPPPHHKKHIPVPNKHNVPPPPHNKHMPVPNKHNVPSPSHPNGGYNPVPPQNGRSK